MEKEPKRDGFATPIEAHDEGTETAPSRIVWRVLILGVVLIILIVLSIGIVKLVPKALSSLASVNISFSSLFTPKEKITVTVDKSRINSGESFNVAWKHTGAKEDGYYNLSTACQDSYRLEYPLGKIQRPVDCKNIVRLDASSTSFTLSGINNGSDTVTVPITIDFISKSDGKSQASGETTIVINPSTSAGANPSYSTSTSNGSNNQTPAVSYPTSGGVADLVVRITALSNANPTASERVAVSFEVQNIGTAPSGPWDLRAVMPAVNFADQTKYLNNNASIPPGLAISGSLYVDQLQAGNNRLIQLSIDPSNRLVELRKDNNVAETTVNVSGSNNNGGGAGGVDVTSSGVDLVVRILDTGVLDSRGQFVSTSRIRSGDRAAVQFQIANQGRESSGSFEYRIEINDADISDDYDSSSLGSGQARIYVASFEDLSRNDDNTVEITADPSDRIDESKENNNNDSDDLNID